jgi:NAD+ synthase
MSLRPSFKDHHAQIVETFIRDTFRQAGAERAVVPLSGGLDSSVTASLCARALGPEVIQALFLGDEVTPAGDRRDAEGLAENLGIRLEVVDISPMLKSFREALGLRDRGVLGNVRARCRMTVAYAYSNSSNGLVVGTGNKSEILVGYFTKYGDGGVDILPIGDLYKTQVRDMARFLGLPRRIIDKVPSAGLWRGQTDEEELGMSYEDLDRILLGLELRLEPEEIGRRTGLPVELVGKVEGMVRSSVHKRKMPLIPKVGIRTVGLDWRE